jgi:hypothetical protein
MKLKRRARMKRMRQARRSACKLGAVSDEFDFFSTDSNNWNYNESVYNKAFQDSKNDYWKILSITTNLFYFCLFRTDETNKL